MSAFLNILLHLLGWSAVLACLGWLMWRWWLATEDRKDLLWRWGISVPVLAFLVFVAGPMVGRDGSGGFLGSSLAAIIGVGMVAVGGLVLAMIWGPYLTDIAGQAVGRIFDGGRTEAEREPMFSMVEARRKQGRYAAAADLMRQQLEEFPTHFRGQMLLAEILANDLHDLDRAASVIEEIARQENHPPRNVAFALTQLADWHLKFAKDTGAARACFERIVAGFPGTSEAHTAEQRLARLAGTETLLARPARRLEAPVADPHLGVRTHSPIRPLNDPDPDEQVAALIAQLEAFPHDNRAREELATLYAGPFRRPDLAVQQMEQLIAQPNAPEAHIARWTNRVADIYLSLPDGEIEARRVLEALIARNPEAALAAVAQRRLKTLGFEARKAKAGRTVRLAPPRATTPPPVAGGDEDYMPS
jgi:hypothetical protein